MTLGGHPVAALDRAVHERRPAQRGVRAGEVHAALGRAQRAPRAMHLAGAQDTTRCRGCRGRPTQSWACDGDDLAPRARARDRGGDRGVVGDVERAAGRAEADEQRRRRPAPWPSRPRSRSAVPWPSEKKSSGHAARDHPRLHALARVVLAQTARRFARDSGGSKAIEPSTPIGTVTTTRSRAAWRRRRRRDVHAVGGAAHRVATGAPSGPRPRTSAAIASYSAAVPAVKRQPSTAASRCCQTRWSAPEIQRRYSSIEASPGGAEAQAAIQSSASACDARREALRGEPGVGRDVEVLEPLRVGRARGVVAAGGGEQDARPRARARRGRPARPGTGGRCARRRRASASAPGSSSCSRSDAVAIRLRPHVRLAVGQPGAAHVEVEAGKRVAPGPDAAADPVARLQHRHIVAARLGLARGDEPREPGADDDDVAQRAAWRRPCRSPPRGSRRACPTGRCGRSRAACRSRWRASAP